MIRHALLISGSNRLIADMAAPRQHNIQTSPDEDDEPVDVMIKKTGCMDPHRKLQASLYTNVIRLKRP